jgi:hypothetical protein
MQPLYDTFKLPTVEEKVAARKTVIAGPLKDKLAAATKLVVSGVERVRPALGAGS